MGFRSKSMERSAREMWEGKKTFAQFWTDTTAHWQGLASMLMRRWRAPAWVEREEIEQELMLGAWVAMTKYEPEKDIKRGGPAAFIVWNAVDKAKKKLHKLRGANLHGNADGATGTWEVPFSHLTHPEKVERISAEDLRDEEQGIDSERQALFFCFEDREREVIRLLAETKSFAETAKKIAGETGVWEQAYDEVCEVACTVAERREAAAA